ncbi:MAG: hypothetical protein ACOYNC_02400 [Bacteroidales bacterium]
MLIASFLTPLVWTFSAGPGCKLKGIGGFSLGITAAKLTWVYNKMVYQSQQTSEFYGVPREKGHVLEYGLTFQLLVDRNIFNRIHWNCDLKIFKNYGKPVDILVKNLIGIRIGKYIKTSVQTRISYEKEVSARLQMENLVTLGFFVSL